MYAMFFNHSHPIWLRPRSWPANYEQIDFEFVPFIKFILLCNFIEIYVPV